MDIRIPHDLNDGHGTECVSDVNRAVYAVNRNRYADYLTWECDVVKVTSRSVTVRLKVGATTGKLGSRRSASGRRGPWACWHVFRDVLTSVFEEFPDATVHTALATYKGRADFHRSFPATYYHEARAAGNSYDFGSLCACELDESDSGDSEIEHAYAVMERAQTILDTWPQFDAVGLPILERG